ncbi:low affinity iron transporter-like protein [Diplocarpon rosae]|nr:low affinity iron transporter-like protein [Diplocarpon rosae]
MLSRWQTLKASIFPANTPIFAAATTQKVRFEEFAGRNLSHPGATDPEKKALEVSSESEVTSAIKPNIFDKITRGAGSSGTFFFMMGLLALWAVAGAALGTTDRWQIILQNASSIQVYVTDILLIRQQKNASRALMTTLAEIQYEIEESLAMVQGRQTRWQRIWGATCHFFAITLGSLWAFIFYWAGIFVWVGIGPLLQFSDVWQLYINTATAISLTFTSVFLQNVQQQQEDRLDLCLNYALKIDAQVEYRLREITEDPKPNPIFEIPANVPSRVERSIDRFADIMGSGLGVIISLLAAGIWFAVGPALTFDDNWWLIIGTFTGLVGFIDGFVLRNLYMREESHAKIHFRKVELADSRILDLLNLPIPRSAEKKQSFSTRISVIVGDACGSRWATVGAVSFVFALLVIASAMVWSTTGQLLCNTSTMIIEGFLLLVLIQAHNTSNQERGEDFNGVLKRRLLLNSYVNAISD